MNGLNAYKEEIRDNGFAVIPDLFDENAVAEMISCIEQADTSNATFRKTGDLFAIRQFVKEIPGIKPLIFTDKFRQCIIGLLGSDYFLVKSIYFDKPARSNWFVAYHQDLTISVDKKAELRGYSPWTVKNNQFAVQPPLFILESNFTIRIHLDDTNETNGALKVIPGSHQKDIYRPETINWSVEKEVICAVKKGGVMVMKPLLLHASNRTTSDQRRRVIHLEFSNMELPKPLSWSERN
jgi:hypothetical protein